MKKIYITFLLVLVQLNLFAGDKEIKRIVLVGDVGYQNGDYWPVLDAVRNAVPDDGKTAIIFLGDNEVEAADGKYPALDAQIALAESVNATAYFLPGEKDWNNGKRSGYKAIKKQNKYLESLELDYVHMYPQNGCAGISEVKIGDSVVLVFMDTEWWLTRHDKPGIESDCDVKTKDQFLDELKDAMDDNANKLIIFAGHHPLKSMGKHSNSYGIKQHIFPLTDIKGLNNFYLPLPVIGSLYPISRNFLYTRQDMIHPVYQEMVTSIDGVLRWYPHVVRVAAHDQSLQLLKFDDNNYIVSGGGSRATRANDGSNVMFEAGKRGFTVLELTDKKQVHAVFYTLDNDSRTEKAFETMLVDYSNAPPLATDTANTKTPKWKDSVTAPANTSYAGASGFRRFLLGDNYREEWATPVKMKVFRLNQDKGGMTINSMGGGKQSSSLHMTDANGTSWTLRSVNKDIEKAIPVNFQETFASNIAQDVVSAAHPYAPLSMPRLSEALDIVHTNPELVFVPDDPAFGAYNPVFANTVCMLEERYPSRTDKKGDNAWKMFNQTIEKDDFTVDQQEFLRARMLDILVADFDRHYDQWKWGTTDTGKGKVYYPIPKDRDQVFFQPKGLVFKILAYDKMPFLKGLKYDVPKIKWMGFSSRDIDRLFLNRLSAEDWNMVLADFKSRVTDNVIEEAVADMPKEVHPIHGNEIIAKLKSRRDVLPEQAMEYYKFLAEYVTVTGTNKDDYFRISNKDGGLAIDVYDRGKNGDTNFLRYSRIFDADDTKEVWLYGFNGEDYFEIDEAARSGIKLRMIGGSGADTFNSMGRQLNFIYDRKDEKNYVVNSSRTRKNFSHNADINEFKIREDQYSSIAFPILAAGYNPDDQFLLGIAGALTKYGFRKEPYASHQRLGTLFSFFNQAYQVRYDGEFMRAIRSLDLVLLAQIKNPALDFFYGLGNETVKDETKPFRYYQARYNYLQGDVMLRKRFSDNLFSVSLGPAYYKYWNNYEDNTGKVLEQPMNVMLDSAEVYTPKLYGGGKLAVKLNNIDNSLLPTHGIDWTTEFTMMTGLDESTQPVTRLQSDVAIYASLNNPGRLISVIRFGGGHIFSEHYEYFQSLRLGANRFLRGYRRDRFAGSSVAYASLELRMKLFDIRSKILPGDFGLIGFDDIGRVWVRGEDSDKWHNSYGGGVYFTPFNMVAIGATLAFSEEDMLFNASIGTNIRIFF